MPLTKKNNKRFFFMIDKPDRKIIVIYVQNAESALF